MTLQYACQEHALSKNQDLAGWRAGRLGVVAPLMGGEGPRWFSPQREFNKKIIPLGSNRQHSADISGGVAHRSWHCHVTQGPL